MARGSTLSKIYKNVLFWQVKSCLERDTSPVVSVGIDVALGLKLFDITIGSTFVDEEVVFVTLTFT